MKKRQSRLSILYKGYIGACQIDHAMTINMGNRAQRDYAF